MKVLNSPLVLTETCWWFGVCVSSPPCPSPPPPVLYPTSPSLPGKDGGCYQGLASLLCQDLSAFYFLVGNSVKVSRQRSGCGSCSGSRWGECQAGICFSGEKILPCEPSGELEVQIQAALNSALIVLRSTKQSSTLRQLFQLHCPNEAL